LFILSIIPIFIAITKNHPHKLYIILIATIGAFFSKFGWLIAFIWCFIKPGFVKDILDPPSVEITSKDNFKFKNNEIEFKTITGEVLDSDKFSETHVSSRGGGGIITPYGGTVSSTKIRSQSVTNHEIWLKLDDGSEKSFKIYNKDVPLRIGHKVTMVVSEEIGTGCKRNTIMYNHTSNQHWLLKSAKELNLYFNISTVANQAVMTLIYTIIMFFANVVIMDAVYRDSFSHRISEFYVATSVIFIISFFIYHNIQGYIFNTRVESGLKVHLKKISDRLRE